MTRTITVFLSGAVGIGLGALSGRILFGGSTVNLVLWAIVAIAIGLVAADRLTALLASGVYGYLLSAVFLYVANTSNAALTQRVLFALALALIGPVCAIAISLLTRLLHLQIVRRRRDPSTARRQ